MFGKEEIWHLCTGENFNIIFPDSDTFKAGVSIFGMCALLYPEMKILTFQFMSNHIHAAVEGKKQSVIGFFKTFEKHFARYLSYIGRPGTLSGIQMKLFRIQSDENLRNVIAYINRNSLMAIPDFTPFTYPWGANRFLFNPEIKAMHLNAGRDMTIRVREQLAHSRKFDNIQGLKEVGGYVSPLCFCDVEEAEKCFADARQYFSRISKNVENFRDIAQTIGETLYYADDDLFYIATRFAKKEFGNDRLVSLMPNEKLSLAKKLHYEYNAGIKQLQRLLKIDGSVLAQLFMH